MLTNLARAAGSTLWLGVSTSMVPAARAADATSTMEPAPQPDRAEYVRLSQELAKLASRNAWAGVERTYRALLDTGHPLSFGDHFTGAHAARSVGDITSARARLLAANAEREEVEEVVNWLWEIDSNYQRVSLLCEPGRRQAVLEAKAVPFNPELRRAVAFTQSQIAATCRFEGYLPAGEYLFGGLDLEVEPRVQSVQMDLRSMEIASEGRRRANPRARERGPERDGE